MSRKQVVFLLLVTVGLVVSRFDDCDVEANQTIAIQTCTLAPQNVSKINGHCPMRDYVIAIPVCKDVKITGCLQILPITEAHCMTFDTQHCVTSYEKHSYDGVETRRRDVDDEDTCEIEKATCDDGNVTAPQQVTCHYIF